MTPSKCEVCGFEVIGCCGCDGGPTCAEHTDLRAFHNRLRRLLNIDLDELVRAEVMDADDPAQWAAFRTNPWLWFIRAPDAIAERVWMIMEGGR